ncbi:MULTISPECIES: hypothetical protein [unclassified Micromonospora]|uniref:hypothetical protein n=1 Tax=unclassified Micromonospora TaxID=2617518 RepID=UPI002FF0E9F9
MPGMLYYPLINPPPGLLRQAVVYWDVIATITPYDYRDLLGEDLRRVDAAGLYRPIREPAGFDLGQGVATLERLLTSVPLDDLLPPTAETGDRRTRVVQTKLSESLRRFLLSRGLARRGRDDWELIVSPAMQLLLTAVIAHSVAQSRSGVPWQPHTDDLMSFRLGTAPYVGAVEFGRPHYGIGTDPTVPCWLVELDGLLPAPAPDTSIADLLAFRQRYEDERRRLVAGVELLLEQLRRHYDRPEDVLRALERELLAALADFRSATRASGLRWVRRSASVAVALGTAAAGELLAPDLGWLFGVAGGLAVNLATGELRTSTEGHPHAVVSYLHRVDRAVGR